MVENHYGKPLDTMQLKSNVQNNFFGQIEYWRNKAFDFYSLSQPQSQCPICESDQYKVVGFIYGWPWHQCKECTTGFLGRQIPVSEYTKFLDSTDSEVDYSETYTDENVQKYRMESVLKPKVEFIHKHIKNKNSSWLDLGSGNGGMVKIANDMGYRAEGVEISQAAVDFAKKHYDIALHKVSIDEYCRENNNKWDVISAIGIFEMMNNPVPVIRDIHSMLNHNGIFAANIANFESLSAQTQFAHSDQIVARVIYPIFYFRFTEKSFSDLLEKIGFEIEAIWHFGMDFYELINNMIASNPKIRNSKLIETLRQYTNEFQLVADQKKMSDNIIFIARKK
tara:strand:+ start:2369 stop:3379 length:1011 start_codon:yes stop_codon:yes gene_type:complete